eukprot:COSAG02_NODE_1424_length_12684_cov_13.471116_14_plen_168_part_00
MSAMRNLRKFQLWEEGGFLHVCNAKPAESVCQLWGEEDFCVSAMRNLRKFQLWEEGGFLHVCNAKPAESVCQLWEEEDFCVSAMWNLRKYQLWEGGGFLHACNAELVEVSGVGRQLESDRQRPLTQHTTRAFVLQSELLTKTSAQATGSRRQQHQQQLWLSVVQKVE